MRSQNKTSKKTKPTVKTFEKTADMLTKTVVNQRVGELLSWRAIGRAIGVGGAGVRSERSDWQRLEMHLNRTRGSQITWSSLPYIFQSVCASRLD